MPALRSREQESTCRGPTLPEAPRVGGGKEGVPGAEAAQVPVQGVREDVFGASPRDQALGLHDPILEAHPNSGVAKGSISRATLHRHLHLLDRDDPLARHVATLLGET